MPRTTFYSFIIFIMTLLNNLPRKALKLFFHRVITNFVAHTKGTVGMATTGKDTGGSQFFFNTADNIHLNGRYTIFARAIKGLHVVEKLEVCDRIISIKSL